MSQRLLTIRTVFGVLFVLLGALIVGRGLLAGAPLSFTGMGLLMILLGLYRLKLLRDRSVGR
jgi:hypothetical protein